VTRARATAALAAGAGLLEQAIGYALSAVDAVTPDLLPGPTPCREWDLRMLLRHGSESLAALQEGIGTGRVSLQPAAEGSDPAACPAQVFRARAARLRGACSGAARPDRVVAIADRHLALNITAAAGAVEIAVHGWDISHACGDHRPIPPALALDLLLIAPLLVTEADRHPPAGGHPLFAAPVTAAQAASPSSRLAAFLGRAPPA